MAHTSFAAVVDAFLASPKFASLRPNTQETWKRYLLFASKHIGRYSMGELGTGIIQELFDGLSSRPGIQAVTLTAIKQVEKLAVKRGYIDRPFTFAVEIQKTDGGHISWTDEQVRFGIENAPRH
jgi:hypothetical protein